MIRRALIALMAVVAPGALTTGPSAYAATRSLADGGCSYFGDPRAVYAHGTTFLGWVTSDRHVQVASLKGKTLRKRTLDYMGKDDHNNPSLYIRRDGHIVAFYTCHGSLKLPASKRHRMFYRITQRPYDISSWGSVLSISRNTKPAPGKGDQGFTYPNPQRVGDRLWLFWRGGSWWPTLSTTQDFVTWTKPRNVVSSINGQRPYAKYDGDGKEVLMAFTRSHPDEMTTGIYFLRISADGTVRRADSTRVGSLKSPVDYRRADNVYRFQKRHGSAWVMDVAADKDHHPVIVYFRREQQGGDTYRYAWWDGQRWVDRRIAAAGKASVRDEPYYQAGATLDHEDPSVVYVSRRVPAKGPYAIELWATPDHGLSWGTRTVSGKGKGDNWRPVSPRGLDAFQVFWWTGRYLGFRDYDTRIVVGTKRAAR